MQAHLSAPRTTSSVAREAESGQDLGRSLLHSHPRQRARPTRMLHQDRVWLMRRGDQRVVSSKVLDLLLDRDLSTHCLLAGSKPPQTMGQATTIILLAPHSGSGRQCRRTNHHHRHQKLNPTHNSCKTLYPVSPRT